MEIHKIGHPQIPTPHSIELEQQLLGAILQNQSLIGLVETRGGVDLFFDPLHARIFEIARHKDRAAELVSPFSVRAAMEGEAALQELGGPKYLVRLAGAALPSAAVSAAAELLREMRAKRQIADTIAAAQAAIAEGSASPGEIARQIEGALIAVDMPGSEVRPVSMLAAVTKAVTMANAAYQGEDDGSVKSGLVALDKMIGGFYPGELTLIGGRPSMGKTGVALSVALNVARAGQGVVIASLEMNPEAMAVRALSEATAQSGVGVEYARVRRGQMQPDEFRRVIETARDLGKLPITFLPRQFSDIGALFSGARQAKRAMGENMRLLIVDYAQLIRSNARTRYEQITEISIALKALAGTLNVPVVALSQLSRAVEQRDDKRPVLSDLRESGQLEQDADAIIFCYRDEYYLDRERPDEDDLEAFADWHAAREKTRNHLELIVAKQRQGEIGTAHLRFNPATNLVWED